MTPRQLVTSFFERVYNEKDLAYVLEIFADDYHEHTETGARSNQGCRDIIDDALSTFPDLRVVVHDVVAQDDLVAARVTFTGTQRGTFLGAPPSGRLVRFEAMEFFRVVDGVIRESWGSWPVHDILAQTQAS